MDNKKDSDSNAHSHYHITNKNKYLKLPIYLTIPVALVIFILVYLAFKPQDTQPKLKLQFDGERAYEDVSIQTSLGPRIPESQAHQETISYIKSELEESGWQVEIQLTERIGHPIQNVIASRGDGRPWIVLGAHFDTRIRADHDPDVRNHATPVPGANDGASGVAVLLELGRVLPENGTKRLWLVFFDAEDNGKLNGWDWILGSQAFVDSLVEIPDAAVIVDMVGDSDLNIYQERNSDPSLTSEIWEQAANLGYSNQFIPLLKYPMIDDHIPFVQRGIPALVIIDFDYPYYHTTQDSLDKVSPSSLKAVGDTLLAWLLKE